MSLFKTSVDGIKLIKKYEGLRLKAYKAVPSEQYYTIGYGHYGKDVAKNAVITEEEADWLLRQDIKSAERAVDSAHSKYPGMRQNQYDALVSFTFNCGKGNLMSLTKNNTRTLEQIGNKITAYNKAGGKVLNGLVKRRKEEQELFFR